MKKEKVVITGGAGFIGSHLAEGWIENGAEVTVLDNFRSGNKENISHLQSVKLVEGSITDKSLVHSILEGADYIHNLAALVSVPESIENPYECVNINVVGLINILESAKYHKLKKVIHFSSAAVYGDNPETPKLTEMRPEPKSPYGITKLDGEYYLESYRVNFGLNTLSFRCFNVFGPRQNPESQYAAAIPIFVSKALLGEEITIYGDGEQTRDFIYVKDIVRANIIAAKNQGLNGVYNLGTGNAISINQLVKLVIELTQSKSKIVYKAERSGDIKHSLSFMSKTYEDLKLNPGDDLVSGLKTTISYFVNLFNKKKLCD